ncbi:MAG: hypothetical protein M3O70_08845 [Actinomycetota bacterium]|nr:hypothetical protein [Actinomycetota bacterium]
MTVVPSWIEAHCVVPDGFRKGAPFRLYDYQLRYFANFYLVRRDVQFDPDAPVLGPAFVYRRGLLVGPQKLGKGPHTGAHVCVEGVGPALFAGWAGPDDGWVCADHGCRCGWEYPYEPGEPMGMPWPTPLIQITAVSEEQTENIYDALRPMIKAGPLSDVVPRTGEEFIRLPGGGRIDTVTSSAQSRLGQRVTFVPQDEVGIWTPRNKMTKVADTQYRGLSGMGGRASLTSNAWDPSEQSVAQQQYESSAEDIYRQMDQPPRTLSYASKRDRAKIHRIVYPPDVLRENGGHVDLDAIEAEAADLVERDAPQAARFYGNQLIAGAGRAVDPDQWKRLARDPGVQPPPGTEIGLGFDGSISDDATILRGCTRAGRSFIVGKWVRPLGPSGKGWRVPRLRVDEAVRDAFATWKVGRMLADPPKWRTEIEGWAAEFGDETVLAFETYSDRRMGPAVDRWLTAIALGEHAHDDDDTTNEHVLNAHKRKARATAPDDDGRTLYVLVKGDDGGKIDAAVADVLALEAAMTMPEDPKPAGLGFVSLS